MHNILGYFAQPYTLFTVTVPWLFVVYWYFTEGKERPPKVKYLWVWMVATLMSYYFSTWSITYDTISLHIIDFFLLYLAFHLYCGKIMSPGAAYSLSYLGLIGVDVSRALELVPAGLASMSTFYFGIGGAGMKDGLCIFPLLAAIFVHYVAFRRGKTKPWLNELSSLKAAP